MANAEKRVRLINDVRVVTFVVLVTIKSIKRSPYKIRIARYNKPFYGFGSAIKKGYTIN